MFNQKMKLFQHHWFDQLNELKREAEGLMEWYLIQENHEPSQISSGDIQEQQSKILAVYSSLESQLPFLLNQSASKQLLHETKSVLDLLDEAVLSGMPSKVIRITTKQNNEREISIDDIVKAPALTEFQVNLVLDLPYSSFLEQVVIQPLDAKRYAYSALLKGFLVEIQHQRVYSFRYLSEVAVDLHNIPGFLVSGFHGFDDDYFWSDIFQRKSDATRYIVQTFLAGLSGFYRVVRIKKSDVTVLNNAIENSTDNIF